MIMMILLNLLHVIDDHYENHAGGRLRHAFIGIGFRERTEAYDFQAALHDHMKYCSCSYIQFYFLYIVFGLACSFRY